MATYDDRLAEIAASIAALPAVVAAGETLGYWTAEAKQREHDSREVHYNTAVRTPDGLRFWLSAGGWGSESKLSCSIAYIEGPHGLTFHPSGEKSSGEKLPEAAASFNRAPEAIARDFYQRVVSNARAIEIAHQLKQRLELTLAQHASLRAYVKKLERMGYEFRHLADDQSHKATGTKAGGKPWTITVDWEGNVSFEASVDVDDFAKVVALFDSRASSHATA